MRPPEFWYQNQGLARLLSPLAAVVAGVTARRVARPGWRAPVPVICCGNAGVGGSGKTPLALDLAARLQARGRRVAFLTRGYGGRGGGVVAVDPAIHDAGQVGDEALLLAALAPTFVCADRVAGARAACAAGAHILVMDDGLQNPGLRQDLAFLVIDGGAGFGNGRVMPAGPLREPAAAAAARCAAAVLIGDDVLDAAGQLPAGLPILRARALPGRSLVGRRVFAFAGIGRPEKFFATLRDAGAELAGARAFADHHRFTAAECAMLLRDAVAADAVPITTAKDAVRLPADIRARVETLDVVLAWDDAAAIERLLDRVA